jgi:hypothetical protein
MLSMDAFAHAWSTASGNMTKAEGTDSYSSVVSLRNLQLSMLLGELDDLKLMVRDILFPGSWKLTQTKQDPGEVFPGPQK